MTTHNRDALLPSRTQLGYVHLTVTDLARSLAFYRHRLGFQLHRRDDHTAYLGVGRDDLLVLTEQPGAMPPGRTTGLYHFAVLVPSRRDLAAVLRQLIETETRLQGGADHHVSEALYLADPDGNGIEIYRDRPRSAWEFTSGRLKMGTDPLDYQGLLAELENDPAPWAGLPPDTVLGHMHLHVANLSEAEKFYTGVIGFEVMVRYRPSASFLSAGGYHHHLGINTWNGVGVPSPPPDAVGLRYFVVQLPVAQDIENLLSRLTQAGAVFETREDGLFVRDPSQNGMLFVSADT